MATIEVDTLPLQDGEQPADPAGTYYLAGEDSLSWLSARGAAFCKVAPWNASQFPSPGKQPLGEGWQNNPLTFDQVRDHVAAGGNAGMLAGQHSGGLCMFDVDEDYGEFCECFPYLATVPTIVRDGADKGKVIFRIAGELPKSRSFKHSPADKAPFFEFLASGRQGVVAGTHPSGNPYLLINWDREPPTFDTDTVSTFCAIWTGRGLEDDEQQAPPDSPPSPPAVNPPPSTGEQEDDGLREAVLAAWPTIKIFEHHGKVAKTRPEGRNGEWLRLFGNGGLFVHQTGGQPDNGWNLVSSEGVRGGAFEAWWYCRHDNVNVPKGGRAFYDLLCEMARAANIPIPKRAHRSGQRPEQQPAGANLGQGGGAPDQASTDLASESGPILLTELGNSRRFSNAYRGQVVHVNAWGWMIWDGRKWEQDETGRAVALGKRIIDGLFDDAQAALTAAQALADQAKNTSSDVERESIKARFEAAQQKAKEFMKWAMSSQTAQKIAAMLSLAESDLPARVDDFDANPWLLNCENGMLDLKTGQLNPHNSSERITKLAGTRYDPQAQCPLWLESLRVWFDGNEELITFIHRAIGMTLTGITSEQVMFFLYGTGKNGKSVFSEVLQALLNEYARRTPTDTLMLKRLDEGIPNDIARLPGARAVIAAELAEGKRLNESLVKDLTGGDRITARFLRKEFFEFNPTFKLWMYGNHKPTIRGTDEGIWRRVRLVPFTVTIPEDKRDPLLVEKLKAELPGILAWAVQGCLEWQKNGLGLPEAVKAATNDYRAEQDMLAAFLDETCKLGPKFQVVWNDLYQAYKAWTEDNGENPISGRKFSQALSERGYKTGDREGGTGRRVIKGIGLCVPLTPPKM